MNTSVVEGEPAELECAPRAAGAVVQWWRVGGGDALAAAPNGSLMLGRAAAADLGEYECRVRSPDGQLQTASAFLDVHCKRNLDLQGQRTKGLLTLPILSDLWQCLLLRAWFPVV